MRMRWFVQLEWNRGISPLYMQAGFFVLQLSVTGLIIGTEMNTCGNNIIKMV